MVEVVGVERDAVGSMLLEYPQIALMVDDVFADFRRREGNSLVIPIEAAVSQLLSGFIIVGKDSLFGFYDDAVVSVFEDELWIFQRHTVCQWCCRQFFDGFSVSADEPNSVCVAECPNPFLGINIEIGDFPDGMGCFLFGGSMIDGYTLISTQNEACWCGSGVMNLIPLFDK